MNPTASGCHFRTSDLPIRAGASLHLERDFRLQGAFPIGTKDAIPLPQGLDITTFPAAPDGKVVFYYVLLRLLLRFYYVYYYVFYYIYLLPFLLPFHSNTIVVPSTNLGILQNHKGL